MSDKRVAIIILSHNGSQYLGDCLSNLKKANYSQANLEIVVVDNGSWDNSVWYLKKNWPTVTLIENQKNLGFAEGNNIGIRYALNKNFDYIYLLNQDTVVEVDFLTEAMKIIENDEKIGAVQSKLLLYKNKNLINSIGNEIHFLGFAFAGGYQQPDVVTDKTCRQITYPSGAGVLLKSEVLKEVGLFNKDFFMYHEDVDLGWRMRLLGYKIMVAYKSVVYHKYEFSRSIEKYYYMERNRYLVILQNYKLATLLLISPACCLMDLGIIFYSIFKGFWKEELKVYLYFLNPKNWEKIFQTREKIQFQRKVKDKEIIKWFTGKIEFQDIKNPILEYIANPIFNLYWQIIKKLIWW